MSSLSVGMRVSGGYWPDSMRRRRMPGYLPVGRERGNRVNPVIGHIDNPNCLKVISKILTDV